MCRKNNEKNKPSLYTTNVDSDSGQTFNVLAEISIFERAKTRHWTNGTLSQRLTFLSFGPRREKFFGVYVPSFG
jgi:hypothetical protein